MEADVEVLVEAEERGLAKRSERQAGVDLLGQELRELIPEFVPGAAELPGDASRAQCGRADVRLTKIIRVLNELCGFRVSKAMVASATLPWIHSAMGMPRRRSKSASASGKSRGSSSNRAPWRGPARTGGDRTHGCGRVRAGRPARRA